MTQVASGKPQVAAPTISQSQWQIVWKQFKKNPLARIGMGLLVVLYFIAVFAGFLAPYGLAEYSTESRDPWAPPVQVHFQDERGALSAPFVYKLIRKPNDVTFRDEWTEDKTVKCPLQFFVNRPETSYQFLGIIPSSFKLFKVVGDCKLYLWGSDSLGRDQFSRVMYGAQVSMTIGILATVFSVVLGMLLGGIAGYFRGWADSVIMRLVEVLSAIPELFLLITLRTLFPINANPIVIFYVVIFLLAFVSWGGIARVIRSQILAIRDVEYVQAADALGASNGRIIWQHLLPNTATFVIISVSLAIPGYILTESALSFIGIGLVEPYASWGTLLRVAQDGGFESISSRPWVLVPGLFIFLAVLAWQFVGDGLRDAFDPRRRT